MKPPVIGITPDRSNTAANPEAEYFLRRNYCAAIADSGGLPLILPYRPEHAGHYLDLLDGLVLSGGMFDIDPALYDAASRYPAHLHLKADRTAFEQNLLRGALARRMPVLGICGGMQLIAVELGAQLVQHIPSECDSALEHKQDASCSLATHTVRVVAGSQLHRIIGRDVCSVNSLHHQCVMAGNEKMAVSAMADDGVIEAIEAIGLSFCIGVQWHPEYLPGNGLFAALAAAARQVR